MTTNRIRIDGKRFYLERSQDLAGLQRQILAAVRAGGGFVRLRTVEDDLIDVLVTPHSMLLVEEIHDSSIESPAYLGERVSVAAVLAQPQFDFEMDEAGLVSAP